MIIEKKPKPNMLWSVLTMRCPRCRRGDMFRSSNAYKKIKLSHIFDMYDNCPVCGQRFDMGEPGFWYGTGYVSYGLAVAISGATFIAWWVLIGVSFNDNRVFYWLTANSILLVVLQPWMMRLSRAIYVYFFVTYDENYESTKATKFDY
ncbi:MAG: DUF983 domain-containing protein [Ginsengibacter sp.]